MLTEVARQMSQIRFERKWIAQCEAARRVKERFGLFNALDYLIGEKLLNFAKIAESQREFAQETTRICPWNW